MVIIYLLMIKLSAINFKRPDYDVSRECRGQGSPEIIEQVIFDMS